MGAFDVDVIGTDANAVNAIGMNVIDVGAIDVDVTGVDVIVTDAIGIDGKLDWTGDADFNNDGVEETE